jgi:hypothetical protein
MASELSVRQFNEQVRLHRGSTEGSNLTARALRHRASALRGARRIAEAIF